MGMALSPCGREQLRSIPRRDSDLGETSIDGTPPKGLAYRPPQPSDRKRGATMQIASRAKEYDVCIVGSGAGGGMAAKVLAEGGADVVLLEAGQWWDAAKDGALMAWAYDSPRRGAGSRRKPFGEFDGCIGGWDLEGEPYTTADGQRFLWWRARMLGGRTNHWGRISLRFGPHDFKGRSRAGLGDDWPIEIGRASCRERV